MESLTGQETKPCRKGRRNSQKICSKVAVDVDSHRGVSSKIVTLSRRIKDLSPLIPILLQYYYSGIGIEGVGERGQGERDRPVMEGNCINQKPTLHATGQTHIILPLLISHLIFSTHSSFSSRLTLLISIP